MINFFKLMLMKWVLLFFVIILFFYDANALDYEELRKLRICAEASERSYITTNKDDRNRDIFLDQNHFIEFYANNDEARGVQTVAWLNDKTNQLMIAHRGTVITETKNLWSDLGILEAIVREEKSHLSTPPSGEEMAEFLTTLTQNNIRKFMNNDQFNIRDVEGDFMIREILNLDRLRIRSRNTYMLGGAGLGLFGAGALAIGLPIKAPIYAVGFLYGAGAAAGSYMGAVEMDQEVQASILKPARKRLSETLDAMYLHTTQVLDEAHRQGETIEEVMLTGHSLGGQGTLAVASRLNINLEVNCYVFNAPGGYQGVVKIWEEETEKDGNGSSSDHSITHAHRGSCVVANAGSFHSNTRSLDFGALYNGNNRGVMDWLNTRLTEHGIQSLNTTIRNKRY